MSIGLLDQQECPLDIQMSIRPVDEQKFHWTFKCPLVQWTLQKCPLDINQMSIRPLDKQKCPLDIQMSIRPLDEQKCPLDMQMSARPLDEWTKGHCLMATTLVSYPHRVRLSRITSLQLPWHCKRYMSIGHK